MSATPDLQDLHLIGSIELTPAYANAPTLEQPHETEISARIIHSGFSIYQQVWQGSDLYQQNLVPFFHKTPYLSVFQLWL